jgi:hypothetical protein
MSHKWSAAGGIAHIRGVSRRAPATKHLLETWENVPGDEAQALRWKERDV